jgi:hypothetical protein
MSARRVVMLLLAGLLSSEAMAERLIVIDDWIGAPRVVSVDTSTMGVLSEDPNWINCEDAYVQDGSLWCGSAGGVTRNTLEGANIDFLPSDDTFDIAPTASGAIAALDRAYALTAPSSVNEMDRTGRITWSATLPGFGIMGLTVPRAGPFEDGILAIAVHETTYLYYLFRWRRDSTGALVQDGPFGPLDLVDLMTAAGLPGGGGAGRHPTAAADGMSFYVVEPPTGRIQEFDVAGYYIRTFATVAPDLAAVASGPGAPIDVPSNILPLDDGSVFVTTTRRLYRYDLDGNITGRCDRIFSVARALTLARPMAFESAGITCRPWSTGFWKRQCASQGLRMPPRPSRRGGLPPIHPRALDTNLPATIAQADTWLAPHGLTACAALQPDIPNTWRDKALRRYAAVALNFESRRQGRRCAVTVDGMATEAGPVLDEVRALLGSSDDEDLKRAFHLTGRLLGEE